MLDNHWEDFIEDFYQIIWVGEVRGAWYQAEQRHAAVQFSVSSALERLQETSFGATNACRSLVCT